MKNTYLDQLAPYDRFEREVTDFVIELLECTNSDAQGIVECQSFKMAQAWGNDLPADETAHWITNIPLTEDLAERAFNRQHPELNP